MTAPKGPQPGNEVPARPITHTDGSMVQFPRNAVRDDLPQASAPVGRVQTQRADILEQQELDPSTIDSNKHYRWVRFGDESRVRRLERRGYTVEHYVKGGVRPLGQPDSTEDGTIRFGDLILMSCPKHMREATEQALFRTNENRLKSAATEQFRQKAQQKGVEFEEQSRETR